MQIDRKMFLQLVSAASLLSGCNPRPTDMQSVDERAETPTADATDDFSLRVLDDVATCFRGALAYIGDKLGIFRAMKGAGPLTTDQLAAKTNLNERYLQEWLAAMATAHYVEYHSGEGTFSLSDEHAAVLTDEDSAGFQGGRLQFLFSLVSAAPEVAKAFQTGQPVTADQYHPDLWKGIERNSHYGFQHLLAQKWLPAVSGGVDRLENGGSVLDYSCGNGGAIIAMARAFPSASFLGRDPFAPSIQEARRAAAEERLDGRVKFEQGSFTGLPEAAFDLITIFKSVHHYPNPVEVLGGLKQALKAEGSLLIGDYTVSENLMENANPDGRSIYGVSALLCLHDSVADGGVASGTGMLESKLHGYGREAGFGQVRRIPMGTSSIGFGLHEMKI
jgi:SAM-dependent methyltransferase